MLKNHLLSILRNLKRNRGYTAINISGLAIGFASALLIAIYVSNEFTYDRHFKDHDRIYRLSARSFAMSSIAHLTKVKEQVSGVEAFVNMMPSVSATLTVDEDRNFIEDQLYYVSEDYFKVFEQQTVYGDINSAFNGPNGLVLAQSMAQKLFGDVNPLGKEVTIVSQISNDRYNVTAVVPDLPVNTHLRFNALARIPRAFENRVRDSYSYTTGYSYFKTSNKPDDVTLNEQVNDIFTQVNFERFGEGKSFEEFSKDHDPGMWVLPLADVHLESNIQFETSEPGNEQYLYIFLGIALFIIVLAAINYINLATAQASKRAKEIGVRTVLGSFKGQLMSRFLAESVLISFVAVLIGFGLAEGALKLLNLSGFNHFQTNVFEFPELLAVTLVTALVTGLLAGIYPAFYLTKFKPSSVLKGDFKVGERSKLFRNALVTFQLVISLTLAVFSVFASKQLHYSLEKDLGFNKDNVIVIDNSKSQLGEEGENLEPLRNELLKNAVVENVAFSHYSMINQLPLSGMEELTPESPYYRIQYKYTDARFVSTMGFELIEGRDFNEELDDDRTAMIINRAMAKKLGGDVLGRRFNANFNGRDVEIVGIVEDFHHQDFSREIGPVVFFYRPYPTQINVRFTGNVKEALAAIENTYAGFTDAPFDYYFFDQKFNQLFQKEERLGQIISLFTGLSVFVALLGLIGLISYKLDQRIKEIGIRKVLGASVAQILTMLSREMVWLAGIALLVAIPLAYFAVSKWMDGFVYHISISASPFIVVGGFALMIIVGIVSLRSLKTAGANPVKALRNE